MPVYDSQMTKGIGSPMYALTQPSIAGWRQRTTAYASKRCSGLRTQVVHRAVWIRCWANVRENLVGEIVNRPLANLSARQLPKAPVKGWDAQLSAIKPFQQSGVSL